MRIEDLKLLDTLVVETVNRRKATLSPDELVSEVQKRARGKIKERVSSADVKSAMWRLAGDRRISLTRERQVASAA